MRVRRFFAALFAGAIGALALVAPAKSAAKKRRTLMVTDPPVLYSRT